MPWHLGFLSFLSGDNLGNYGLWDQLEALKWIKKNIANFGGDPHRLTAFGSGSGAISIHLLMMTHHADSTYLVSSNTMCSMFMINDNVDLQTLLIEPYFKAALHCLLWRWSSYQLHKRNSSHNG